MHDVHHFLKMLLVGDSPLVDNTSFSIESNSVVRCSCGAMGSKPCVSDICLFVNVDGPTLAGQLDKLYPAYQTCEASANELHLGFSWSRPHIEHLSVAPLAGPPQTRKQT